MLQKTIGVCVLTLNGAHHLPYCLPPLVNSPLKPRVLVVDSSSKDDSAKVAQEFGCETLIIEKSSFNHGTTREMARKHLQSDIVVMVTQDAYATNENVLEVLIEPIINGKATASYARQIPHKGAGVFESFHREFNYPPQSELRSLKDLNKLGNQLYFFSNSFAAYDSIALDSIGGFQNVLLGEDTFAIAKLIQKGHSVAYVAEAVVYHSHNYGLKEEFQRHFDTGFARHSFNKEIFSSEGDASRGKLYVKNLLNHLWQNHSHLIPYSLLLIFTKWLGYQLGKLGHKMPASVNRTFSAYKSYWNKET